MADERKKAGSARLKYKMTKREVGVWNGPKKHDVIYEQPLNK